MKKTEWDDCKRFSNSGTYLANSGIKTFRLIEPGMKGSAYHQGKRIDIRIIKRSDEKDIFEGEIVQIHTEDETSGDLEVGDIVRIPLKYVCDINHDKL